MNKRIFIVIFGLILSLAAWLRLYGVTQFPPAPYWEEVALGYDAYSILQTGRDHHGQFLPVVAFESFGDWKPSLYFYALVPFIKLFGLTTLAVRLPSVLSGIFIVWGVGVLIGEIVTSKNKESLQLVAMFVTAISPWAIQFSRAGWEVNLATALILWGVVFFIKELNSKKSQLSRLLISAVLLSLSMYTYHSARVIAPLLGLALTMIWLQKNAQRWAKLVLPALVTLIMVAPIIFSLASTQTTQRFAETSIFSDLSIIEKSNLRQERAGHSLVSRIIYHRYLLFGKEIIKNFLDHFEGGFLFVSGDKNPRHSIQYMGTFYHLEAIFLSLGFYALFNHKIKYRWLLLWWLMMGILPSALTKTTPHALRILPTLPVWMVLISLGIQEGLSLAGKYKKAMVLTVALIYVGEISMFWRFYSRIYPALYGSEWQVGYKKEIEKVETRQRQNPNQTITVSREKGRPAMYYWFYTQTDPREVQAENTTAKKDQGEFLEFKNLRFE